MSPVTRTNVKLAMRPATRQNKLSAAMKNNRTQKASQGLPLFDGADSASTSLLTPYCVLTEHVTAATTATAIAA